MTLGTGGRREMARQDSNVDGRFFVLSKDNHSARFDGQPWVATVVTSPESVGSESAGAGWNADSSRFL